MSEGSEDSTKTAPFALVPGGAIDTEPEREIEEAEPSAVTGTLGVRRRLGRYELLFELATGGMATVYLARDARHAGFEKLVAVKRIHTHLAKDTRFVEMFLDEARIASRLSHPNVCTVFDFDQDDGIWYLAMEYLLGETLSRVLRRAVKQWDEQHQHMPGIAARIIADACEGLHAAHELRDESGEPLNVIHRDVSPQNIFITYDGSVRIVDFGIARARGRLHHTTTGTVKGKYAYMSPEQLRDLSLDRRTDVWALGVVLWELVVGRRLFRRNTEVDTILAVTNEPIPMPSEVRPDLPPALDQICKRALSRDPDERYPTTRQMGRDLNVLMSSVGAPVSLADLADWMEHLFPEERARRLELIDLARQSGGEGVPKVSSQLFSRDTTSTDDDDDQDLPVTAHVSERPAAPPAELPARRWRWLAAGALAAVAAAVGWSFVAGPFARPEPEEIAGDLTADVAAPPPEDVADVEEPPEPEEPANASDPVVPATAPAVDSHPETAPPSPATERRAKNRDRTRGTDRDRVRPESMATQEVAMATAMEVTPPATGPPGHLNVLISDNAWWANIYVDGTHHGRTPKRIELQPGPHSVRLVPGDGRPEIVRQVTVRSGERTVLRIPSDP